MSTKHAEWASYVVDDGHLVSLGSATEHVGSVIPQPPISSRGPVSRTWGGRLPGAGFRSSYASTSNAGITVWSGYGQTVNETPRYYFLDNVGSTYPDPIAGSNRSILWSFSGKYPRRFPSVKDAQAKELKRIAAYRRKCNVLYQKIRLRDASRLAQWRARIKGKLTRLDKKIRRINKRLGLPVPMGACSICVPPGTLGKSHDCVGSRWINCVLVRRFRPDKYHCNGCSGCRGVTILELERLSLAYERRRLLASAPKRTLFRPPGYRPKYYDFRTGRAVGCYASLPLASGSLTLPRPVWHLTDQIATFPWSASYSFTTSSFDISRVGRANASSQKALVHQNQYPPGNDDEPAYYYWKIPNPLSDIEAMTYRFEYDRGKVSAALASLLPEIKAEVDVPLFFAEIGDIPRTLTSCLKAIGTVARSGSSSIAEQLSSLIGRTASGDVWRDFYNAAKFLAGADLARKFGAEPAVRDILAMSRDMTEKLANNVAPILKMIERSGETKSFHRKVLDEFKIGEYSATTLGSGPKYDRYDPRYSSPGFSPGSVDDEPQNFINKQSIPLVWSHRRIQRLTAIASIMMLNLWGDPLDPDDVCDAAMRDMLGLYIRPGLIWDKIPFSFVVDWVLNVGDLIDSHALKNIRSEMSVYSLVLSELQVWTYTVKEGSAWDHQTHVTPFTSSDECWSCSWGGATCRSKLYRRRLLTPKEFDQLLSTEQLRWSVPNWWQIITGIELML